MNDSVQKHALRKQNRRSESIKADPALSPPARRQKEGFAGMWSSINFAGVFGSASKLAVKEHWKWLVFAQ